MWVPFSPPWWCWMLRALRCWDKLKLSSTVAVSTFEMLFSQIAVSAAVTNSASRICLGVTTKFNSLARMFFYGWLSMHQDSVTGYFWKLNLISNSSVEIISDNEFFYRSKSFMTLYLKKRIWMFIFAYTPDCPDWNNRIVDILQKVNLMNELKTVWGRSMFMTMHHAALKGTWAGQ